MPTLILHKVCFYFWQFKIFVTTDCILHWKKVWHCHLFRSRSCNCIVSLRAIQNHYFILSPETICLKELYGAEYCRKWEGFYHIKRRKLMHLPNSGLTSEDRSLWVFSSADNRVWDKESVQRDFSVLIWNVTTSGPKKSQDFFPPLTSSEISSWAANAVLIILCRFWPIMMQHLL